MSGIFGGDAPDQSGINRAAEANAAISKEALDWYKQAYADSAPQRQQTQDNANAIAQAQLKGMQYAQDQAEKLQKRNETIYQPLEDKIVSEAQNYDTPEREQQAAQSAMAGVQANMDAQKQAADMALSRTGQAPGSGRAMALDGDYAVETAKGKAMAGDAAIRATQQQGYARQMDAAGLGKGIVANQGTMQSLAQSGGAQSVGASGAALGAQMSGAGLMQQGFSTALQGNQSAGQLYGTAASIQNQANANDNALTGTLLNAGVSLYKSDEDVKTDTDQSEDPDKALKQIAATPVKKDWKYDPSKGGPDDGAQPHTGPMAQQVRKHMGEAAAPGGKVIDIITMNGKILAGMQALNAKVKKLEARKAA